MPTKRTRRIRKRAAPDIVASWWAGLPPPDFPATPETRELHHGCYFFNEGHEAKAWTGDHHPFVRQWWDWSLQAEDIDHAE
jgi:hypothetical protein